MSKLVFIEGPKGSGKTTLIKLLADKLSAEGKKVHTYSEPDGGDSSPMSREIRTLLKSDIPRGRKCEFLMLQAARLELFEKEIEPLLSTDTIILVDRSIFSSLVTQFTLHGVGFVPTVHRLTADGYSADLVVWLLPPLEFIKENIELRDDNYDMLNPTANIRSEHLAYNQVANITSKTCEAAFAKDHFIVPETDMTVILERTLVRIEELPCSQ